MQAFKLFFRIVQKNLASISIYLVVFSALAVLFATMGTASTPTDFLSTRVNMAIDNRDGDAAIARGLSEYLAREAKIVALDDDRESRQDALFFREVEYILIIPAGFSEGFLRGDADASLQKMSVPDSMAAVQVEFLINRYLNLARVYASALPDAGAQRVADHVAQNLERRAETQLTDAAVSDKKQPINNYFSYYPYPVMSILILAITSVMLSVGQADIRRRNAASPVRNVRFNLQLVAASVLLALAVWGVLSLTGGLLYADGARAETFLPLLVNALAYTLVCLSLSFLLGYLIKGRSAQAAISNVVSLGLCFVSGVFVPQEYLGETVRKIASFTPTYWYVSAVNWLDPSALSSVAAQARVVQAVLIQLGFAAAFLSVALAVSRHRNLAGK